MAASYWILVVEMLLLSGLKIDTSDRIRICVSPAVPITSATQDLCPLHAIKI